MRQGIHRSSSENFAGEAWQNKTCTHIPKAPEMQLPKMWNTAPKPISNTDLCCLKKSSTKHMRRKLAADLHSDHGHRKKAFSIYAYNPHIYRRCKTGQTLQPSHDISCKTTTFAQICCNDMLMGSPPHLFEALAISCDPKGPAQKHLPQRLQHALKHFSFLCARLI